MPGAETGEQQGKPHRDHRDAERGEFENCSCRIFRYHGANFAPAQFDFRLVTVLNGQGVFHPMFIGLKHALLNGVKWKMLLRVEVKPAVPRRFDQFSAKFVQVFSRAIEIMLNP